MQNEIVITLKQILETGQFGPLQLGITRKEVHQLMGQCEGWSVEDGTEWKAKVWKYGIMQIAFRNDILIYIFFYPHSIFDLPSHIILEGYFPNQNTTYSEFVEYLEREQIIYKVDPNYSIDNRRLNFGSKFDASFNEDGIVESIFISNM